MKFIKKLGVLKKIYFLGLLALLVASSYGCEDRPNLSKRLKNGYVDVHLKNNSVYFTIRKTGK